MDRTQQLFNERLNIINVGLERFSDSVKEQEVPAIQVDWKPPAGGNRRLMEILEKLNQ